MRRQAFWHWFQSLRRRQALFLGVVLAVLLETVTCVLRFGAGLQSTRDTRLLAYLTLGFRIHHGYVGLLLLVIAARLASKGWRNLLIVAGFALFLSDLLHHFAI